MIIGTVTEILIPDDDIIGFTCSKGMVTIITKDPNVRYHQRGAIKRLHRDFPHFFKVSSSAIVDIRYIDKFENNIAHVAEFKLKVSRPNRGELNRQLAKLETKNPKQAGDL